MPQRASNRRTYRTRVSRFGAIHRAVAVLGAAGSLACGATPRDYDVVADFPHDTSAYTQGLLWHEGWLYESTGRYGHSELRRVELSSGTVAARHALPAGRFGEGLALLDEKLFQLTWQSQVGYVYDLATLALVDSFTYEGEGWGLTTDGTHLIMSNGTAMLRFLDPDGFRVVREMRVTDNGSPLTSLNELEYVNGELLANIYQSDWIVRVSLETGHVLQWIDLIDLLPRRLRAPATDVLNGIALHQPTGNLLVTGKLWPRVYEIRLR